MINNDFEQLRIKIFRSHIRIEYLIKSDNNPSKWFKLNGPAVIYDSGDKYWIINNKCHRNDGPAIIWPDGDKRWYFDENFI